MADQELRTIAPTAIVGYGFEQSSPERVLQKDARLHCCGAVEDSDVYGAQQHGPRMDVEIPI